MTGEKLTVGRVTVELSNTHKVLFPGDGITKGDLVEYYQAVAGEMLPLLRDRPVSMTRFPDGLTKAGIVQKNVPAYFPDWITRVRVRKEGGSLRQVVCDKPATIVYLANQACIELHAFLSRLAHIDQPDQLIFDLDPPDGDRFADVRVCALRLRELLAGELGLPAFVKTTGGNGLHVHVPLNARQDFDTVREFARQAAELLAARNPDLVTTEQRKDKRGPRIYADLMRNAYAQLAVTPYSVRARPGAPVATPLSWDELEDQALRPGRFTLRTVPRRIREAGQAGGPWAELARRRPGLARAQESLRRLTA
jgi:bifunctional non-homologous end joining protein LigD